jgi:hypothetical protein
MDDVTHVGKQDVAHAVRTEVSAFGKMGSILSATMVVEIAPVMTGRLTSTVVPF